MLKHTKSQVNEFCFPKCVLLSCLSPQFECYFLLSYDGQRKRVFTILILVNSGAFLSISSWFCELTELYDTI